MESVTPENDPTRLQDTPLLPPERPHAIFQDATGFTIRESQFMNVHGGVHIHPIDQDLRALGSLADRQTATMPSSNVNEPSSENEIYCSQLWLRRRGCPLYVPGPQRNLPQAYRSKGIAIGDVGRVTPDGIWDFFFNIFLEADHPINGNRVPEDFRPLPRYDPIDVVYHDFEPGNYVSSPSVQSLNQDIPLGYFPGGDFLFECHGPRGALLALPYGSHLEKLENVEDMRRYARKNAERWYKYINGTRGRHLGNGGLYLITGCEKSYSGGMASFQNVTNGNDFHLVFQALAGPDGGTKYYFTPTRALTKTFSVSALGEEELPLNNTVFLHGFTITLGEGIWGTLFANVGISQITESPFQREGGSYIPFTSPTSPLSFLSLSFLTGGGGSGGNHNSGDRVILSDLSPPPQIIQPSQVINAVLLRQIPQAEVAITHDDDWGNIFCDDSIKNVGLFLDCIQERLEIVEEDGAVYSRVKLDDWKPGITISRKPILKQEEVGFEGHDENENRDGERAQSLAIAHFILLDLEMVYPISTLAPPWTPMLRDEKRAVEDREHERRLALRANNDDRSSWWGMATVESFYRVCCESCQEPPDLGILAAIESTPPTHPRRVDFSGVKLDSTSAALLADVLRIDWGLRVAVFRDCDLNELTLKIILHALLFARSLSFLSIAANPDLTGEVWDLVEDFVVQAPSLECLDLSGNSLDEQAVREIGAALSSGLLRPPCTADTNDQDHHLFELDDYRSTLFSEFGYGSDDAGPENPSTHQRGLVSLKLDRCTLDGTALETLSLAMRTPNLRHLSLRYSHMLYSTTIDPFVLPFKARGWYDVLTPPTPLPLALLSPAKNFSLYEKHSHALPPSQAPVVGKLIRSKSVEKTEPSALYVPYQPKKRNTILSVDAMSGIPTAVQEPHKPIRTQAPISMAPALDALPAISSLRTLDLRGNEFGTNIIPIAQVLTENRTLKLLNLADNKLDATCLKSIANALQYNSSLEMLDLSQNPCSGPGLDGIESLQLALMSNSTMKRLSLSSTRMGPPGALVFTKHMGSLLHIDLTRNALGPDGLHALSRSLETNKAMRCLDVSVPPDDEKSARICRYILAVCRRNTEGTRTAEPPPPTVPGHSLSKVVQRWIEGSELAKSLQSEEKKRMGDGSSSTAQNRDVTVEQKDEDAGSSDSDTDKIPMMPRVDKGKGHAIHDSKASEESTSPPQVFFRSQDDEYQNRIPGGPTIQPLKELSRRWAEEEGEVFRKAAVLLSGEKLEADFTAKEMKQELLDATIRRPSPRKIAATEMPPSYSEATWNFKHETVGANVLEKM